MKSVAVRSDFDFRFLGFRVLGFFGFLGFRFWKVEKC